MKGLLAASLGYSGFCGEGPGDKGGQGTCQPYRNLGIRGV